jgi:hypothetical protein
MTLRSLFSMTRYHQSVFDLVKGIVDSPVREESTPPQQPMRLPSGQLLESLQQVRSDGFGAELGDQLGVVTLQ